MRNGLGGDNDLIALDNGDVLDTVTGTAYDENGNPYVYGQESSNVTPLPDQIVIPAGTNDQIAARVIAATASNPGAKITLPSGLSDATINNIMSKIGTSAGNWIAAKIGGSTILTRSNGGFSTMNIQSLIVPAAIVAAIVLLGKH